ncbi:MAG TPA: universal stress protein, partial [Candidatus Melainabacteria bacterium]|nr:universal stress protein [Candidatus Melainabacteria bacterium]
VADPTQADSLLQLAARLAKHKQYELECLNVILIPKETDPAEATFSDENGRIISSLAEAIGHEFKIPVHTNIRVAHDIGDAISDTIRERKINLFLMRWTGSKREQKGDDLLHSVLQNTRCGVVLASRLTTPERKENYLVPAARFLDAGLAVDLLPVVTKDDVRETINLCNVSKDGICEDIDNEIELLAQKVRVEYDLDVERSKIIANSNTKLLNEISMSQNCDVVVIGMSRKSLVKSMHHRSFKKMISKGKAAVVLVCKESKEP